MTDSKQKEAHRLLKPVGVPSRRPAQLGGWLISTLAWWPFLAWAVWPLLDSDLAPNPWVACASALVLAANWAVSGWYGDYGKTWMALLAAGAVFALSYSVAARPGSIGAFLVVSTLLWALANSVVGGLVSAWATDRALIRDYSAAEETVLRSVMFSETAMMAGVATARVGENLVSFLIGLAGGILVGGIISWFVFAMVYATMNVVLTMVRNE